MIIPENSVQNDDRGFYKFYKFKPKCSLIDLIDLLIKPRIDNGYGAARGGMECEIHIGGDFLFQAFGALGAVLAYLTYTAITTKGKKRRKRNIKAQQNKSLLSSFLTAEFADLIIIGKLYFLWNNHKFLIFFIA